MSGAPREWSPCYGVCGAVTRACAPLVWGSAPTLTALDAEPLHLAVGTNHGNLFWYDRLTANLQRLRSENSNSAITRVKIVSTVDYMVAAGNKLGQVTIFQIPKPHPDSIPDYIKPKANQQVERYTIGELHKAEITSLEWSKNGMKLFSGDKNGVVVMTEIDFYMHICKSLEIINESYEIVQLSYYQNRLLISSTFRSIICEKQNLKWDVNQVGKKDRKNLCKLGGIFHFNYDNPSNLHIYSARPGLRVWTSDFQGNVLETLLFKDAVTNPTNYVDLLNPATKKKNISVKDTNFGPLFMFNDKYLISYNEDILYILDPEALVAVATVNEFRKITSVAVNKEEIFVLEGDSNIVRLSYVPDVEIQEPGDSRMTRSLMNPIQLAINTIKDIANSETKLYFSDVTDQCDNILNSLQDSIIPTFTDTTSIVKAEECFELPPVKDLSADIDNGTIEKLMFDLNVNDKSEEAYTTVNSVASNKINEKKMKIFDSIGQTDFPDDILYSSKKIKRITTTDAHIESNDTNIHPKIEIHAKMTKPSLMTMSACFDNCLSDKSPDTLKRELKDKEEKLAKALNLETITISPIVIPTSSKNDEEEFSSQIEPISSTNISNITKNVVSDKNLLKHTKTKKEKTSLIPECVSIPDMWNLQEIQMNSNSHERSNKRVENDILYDADWELV